MHNAILRPATTAVAVIALLVIGLAATPAQAGFKFVQKSVAPSLMVEPSAHVLPAPLPLANGGQASDMSVQTRYGTVDGFGDQVPLTVALRQILPRGVMFTVADNVDIATQVSWSGGRPWQQVLEDSLGQAGLRPVYSQNSVTIEKLSAAPAPIRMGGPVVIESPAPLIIDSPVADQAPLAANDAPPTLLSPEQAYDPSLNAQPSETEPTFLPAQDAMQPAPMPAPLPVAQPYNEATADNTFANGPMIVGADGGLSPTTPGIATPTSWSANSGQTLHEVLQDWAGRMNIELNWISEYDYPIQASIHFNGTFEDAVRTLLAGFINASPQPVGRLHKNEELGQMALVIEMRGNNYDE